MLLVVDVGNTHSVFALYEGERLVRQARLETGGAYTPFFTDFIQSDKATGIIVASVVPEIDQALGDFLRSACDVEPLFVNARNAGVELDLDRPDEIGADRVVNAAAVKALYHYPAIVIDFGTATTFDVVDEQGRYAGGMIAPGINLSLEALERAAAKLPLIEIKKPVQAIGKNTKEAMEAGIYWGYVGLIRENVAQISKALATKPFVLATGGLAPLFSALDAIDDIDQELTLKGLRCIYQAQT